MFHLKFKVVLSGNIYIMLYSYNPFFLLPSAHFCIPTLKLLALNFNYHIKKVSNNKNLKVEQLKV